MLRAAAVVLLAASGLFAQTYADGLRLLGARRELEALETLKLTVRRDPSVDRAYGRILQLIERTEGLPSARRYFEQLFADGADTAYAHYAMALLLRREGANQDAWQHLRASLRQSPRPLAAYVEFLQVARLLGRLDEAAKHLETIGDSTSQFGLGYLFQQRGGWEKALEHLRRAPEEYEVWGLLFTIYSQHGPVESALEACEKTLAKAEREDDIEWMMRAHGRLGVLYNNGDYLKAIEHFLRAIELSIEFGERAAELTYHSNLGLSFQNLGQSSKAAEHYTRALILAREVGARLDEGRNLGLLANIHTYMGLYEDAIMEYSQAAQIAEETGDRASAAAQIGNQAAVFLQLNNHDRAVDSATRALRLAGELKLPWLDGGTEEGMAAVHLATGKPRLALASLERALENARVTSNRKAEAARLELASQAHEKLGEIAQARAKYAAALVVAESSGMLLLEGKIRNGLGSLLLRSRDWPGARDQFRGALALGERTQMPEVIWRAYAGLAAVNESGGNLAEASRQYALAVDFLERLRSGLSLEDEKAGYFQEKVDVYARFVRLLVRRGEYERAFHYSERSRARSLLDLLSEAGVAAESDPPHIAGQRVALEQRISALQARIIRAGGARSAALEKTYTELTEVDREYQDLRRRMRRERSGAANLAPGEPVTIEQARRTIHRGAIALEYLLGERESFVFALTNERLRVFRLPAAAVLAGKVNRLLSAVRDQPDRVTLGRYAVAARDLYTDLIQPLESMLTGKRQLTIVPDGILYSLPFEVLLRGPRSFAVDQSVAELPYLLRDFSLSYVPSLSVLAVLRQGRRAAPQPMHAFLAFADPAYGGRLPRLIETRAEVERIAGLYGAAEARLFTGEEATETNAKAASIAGYRTLEFAVHGLLNDRKPQFSGLALSTSGKRGGTDDGLLESYEIAGLKLGAEMVVLSACETGLGKAVKGEGLLGLVQSFLHAGARSVLASLWKVEDRSTSDLMVRFHEQLKSGATKPEALRQAKLSLIESGTYAHPYYWAAFVLSGVTDEPTPRGTPPK